MMFAAFLANTTHAKGMQTACCIVLCLLYACWHALFFGFFWHALVRTGCPPFWDIVCICILYALVLHLWAYVMQAQGMQKCVLVFACMLHVYCMMFAF